MNRRSLLRAIGLTAAFVGPEGRYTGGPPYADRPSFAPPAARHDRRPPPPRPHGYIWTDGYWRWQRGRYIWVSGRWVARRPGRRWVPGYWRRQGPVWVYVDGSWR